jgi:hypothetical protein
MKIVRYISSLSQLLVLACLTLNCGSSSGRQLKSITITQSASGQQILFAATGNFSSAPATVTPLAVSWGIGPFAPQPLGALQYTLTTKPFVFNCTGSGPYLPVSVLAPSDPNAPVSGSLPFKQMITATAPVDCQ